MPICVEFVLMRFSFPVAEEIGSMDLRILRGIGAWIGVAAAEDAGDFPGSGINVIQANCLPWFALRRSATRHNDSAAT